MPYAVFITQSSWIDSLRNHGYDEEVNFWRPSGKGISTKLVGSYMIFVRKGKLPRKVMGYAKIKSVQRLEIREAWECWGVRNGVSSLQEFVGKVGDVATASTNNGGNSRNVTADEQSMIGCIVLTDVVFFTEEVAPVTNAIWTDFPARVVVYKVYPESFPPRLKELIDLDPQLSAQLGEPSIWTSEPILAETSDHAAERLVPRSHGSRHIDFETLTREARYLGLAGEQFVLSEERKGLEAAGRADLALLVEHTSVTVGDGAGYDIRSYSRDGQPKFIEVKTTTGPARKAFIMSANERAFAEEHPDKYWVYRVYHFNSRPQVREIPGTKLRELTFEPIQFRVQF